MTKDHLSKNYSEVWRLCQMWRCQSISGTEKRVQKTMQYSPNKTGFPPVSNL